MKVGVAGRNAAVYARERWRSGTPSLAHVKRYNEEVKRQRVDEGLVAPMLLPDYSNPIVRQRQLTTRYLGNLL